VKKAGHCPAFLFSDLLLFQAFRDRWLYAVAQRTRPTTVAVPLASSSCVGREIASTV
jgi:hypothetical protein